MRTVTGIRVVICPMMLVCSRTLAAHAEGDAAAGLRRRSRPYAGARLSLSSRGRCFRSPDRRQSHQGSAGAWRLGPTMLADDAAEAARPR